MPWPTSTHEFFLLSFAHPDLLLDSSAVGRARCFFQFAGLSCPESHSDRGPDSSSYRGLVLRIYHHRWRSLGRLSPERRRWRRRRTVLLRFPDHSTLLLSICGAVANNSDHRYQPVDPALAR